MRKVISLCLGGGRPSELVQSAALVQEPVRLRDDAETLNADAKWQALYNRLHLLHGSWLERLAQLIGLVASSCGAAMVSLHLYCPAQACFVVLISGGPQADLVQRGELHPVTSPAPPPSAPFPSVDPTTHRTLDPSTSSSCTTASATATEPQSSLQQLLMNKAPLHRHISPHASAAKHTAPPPPLPPDWRRLHVTTALTDFAALPITGPAGDLLAALSIAGPGPAATAAWPVGGAQAAAAASTTAGNGCGAVRLGGQLGALTRAVRVLGLAFLSDSEQLAVHQLACNTMAALQRTTTLQGLLDAAHSGLSSLLHTHLHLDEARCVLAIADTMEGRIAYFAPVQPHTAAGAGMAPGAAVGPAAVSGPGPLPRSHGAPSNPVTPNTRISAAAAVVPGTGTGASPAPSPAPLAGVLGPLVGTLLLDLVSGAGGRGPGAVLPNVRYYLQQEDKPGRDVQVVLQLSHLPPACLLLAHGGDPISSLAPEVAVYVCVPQQGLSAGLLEGAKGRVHGMLQLLLPILQRLLMGPMAAEWGSMRLTSPQAPGSLTPQRSHSSGGTAGSGFASGSGGTAAGGGDGPGSEGSLGSVLGSFSVGGLSVGGASSVGGLSGGLTLEVDELVSASPGHLKTLVAGIQSSISAAQMAQAWAAASEEGAREALDDLYSIRLLETVGQGGQGVVFRGLMHGLEVAVKVVAKDLPGALIAKVQQQQQQAAAAAIRKANAAAAAAGMPPPPAAAAATAVPPVDPEQLLRAAKREMIRDALELAVTSAVSYPHIVQVHNYFFDVLVVGYTAEDGTPRLPEPALLPGAEDVGAGADTGGGGAGGASANANAYLRLVRRADATEEMVAEGPTNLVIVMEYCDSGTLKDVLRRGGFKRGVDAMGWPRLELQSLYNCLLEVALALRHMHALGLVHCDLKPSNVLLRTAPRDPRGWTCKLSDFGCVRMLRPPAEDGSGPRFPHFTVTRALGTLTHMAPEVISKGAFLTTSVDVYSFGIMMAELAVGSSQDSCLPGKEAIALARKGVRPPLPPYCPKEYRDVAVACWSHDPHARPSAAELVNVLQALLNQLQGDYSSGGFYGGDPVLTLMHLVAPQQPPPPAVPAQHTPAAAAASTHMAPTALVCPTAHPHQVPQQTTLQHPAYHQQQQLYQKFQQQQQQQRLLLQVALQQQQQQLYQQAQASGTRPPSAAQHQQPQPQLHQQQQQQLQTQPDGAVPAPILVPAPPAAGSPYSSSQPETYATAGSPYSTLQPAPCAAALIPGSAPGLTPYGPPAAGGRQSPAGSAAAVAPQQAGDASSGPIPSEAVPASYGAATAGGGGGGDGAATVPAAAGGAGVTARTCTAASAAGGNRLRVLFEEHWDRRGSAGGAGEGHVLRGSEPAAEPACGANLGTPAAAAAAVETGGRDCGTPAAPPQRQPSREPQAQPQGLPQPPNQQYDTPGAAVAAGPPPGGNPTIEFSPASGSSGGGEGVVAAAAATGATLVEGPAAHKPSDATSPASAASIFSAASVFAQSPSSISGSAVQLPTPLSQSTYAVREHPGGKAPGPAGDTAAAATMAVRPLDVVPGNVSATFGDLVLGPGPAGGGVRLEEQPQHSTSTVTAGHIPSGEAICQPSGGGDCGQYVGPDSESGMYNSACSTTSVKKGGA